MRQIVTDRFTQVVNDIDTRMIKRKYDWRLERVGNSFRASIMRDDGDPNFVFEAMHNHAEYAMLNAYSIWVSADYGKRPVKRDEARPGS